MHHPVKCCCCDARQGLRILGWWWLVECIFSLLYIWLPGLWLTAVVTIVSLFPPFLSFMHMTKHHDAPETRHKLAQTYLKFAIMFGLIASFGAAMYAQSESYALQQKLCEISGQYPCYYTYTSWGVAIGQALFSMLIVGLFRFYFFNVMKRYHEEGVHFAANPIVQHHGQHHGQPHATVVVQTQAQYAYQPMQAQPGMYAPQQAQYTAPMQPGMQPGYVQGYPQPGYGQPAYGQPAYGQPAYGQPGSLPQATTAGVNTTQ